MAENLNDELWNNEYIQPGDDELPEIKHEPAIDTKVPPHPDDMRSYRQQFPTGVKFQIDPEDE